MRGTARWRKSSKASAPPSIRLKCFRGFEPVLHSLGIYWGGAHWVAVSP